MIDRAINSLLGLHDLATLYGFLLSSAITDQPFAATADLYHQIFPNPQRLTSIYK